MARAALAATPSESRSRTLFIAAVIISAIAAVLLFVALQNRGGDGAATAAATTDVVVAATNIDANTMLTADLLEVRAVSVDDALAGAYATTDAAIGLPARYPIQKGEQVTTGKLGLEAITDEKDLALVLDAGQRAVAIEVSEITSVGGLLLPGNFVDLIAVLDGGEEGLGDNKAVTVLQNIEVLAVAQEAQEPIPAVGTGGVGDEASGTGVRGQRPDEVERQPGARTVTVAVTPQEAQLLGLLQMLDSSSERGIELMLTLRPVGETDATSVPDFFPPNELILPPPPPQP